MDKNKAAFKLKSLPHIYYLNLDEEPERMMYMEAQLKYWEIENYTRISAYDGRDDRDLGHILKGTYPDGMSAGEVGCTTSHLKAMKEFLKTDAPCAIMMEDDCDIGTAAHWPFEWRDFFCKIPYDYDVIQLVVINPAAVHLQMHRRFVNDFSTACYLITRRHAQKLMELHVRGDKYKIDNGVKPRAVADDLIYNSGNTFAIPLFLFRIQLGSSIHAEHLDVFHKSSYDGLWKFWQHDASTMENWDAIFEYDPYFGRLPPGFEGK